MKLLSFAGYQICCILAVKCACTCAYMSLNTPLATSSAFLALDFIVSWYLCLYRLCISVYMVYGDVYVVCMCLHIACVCIYM